MKTEAIWDAFWKSMANVPMSMYRIKLHHAASIPGARWCSPVGWEPSNTINGAEYVDGSWWGDAEEEAGLVAFVPYGDESEVVLCELDDLRVASCGDCRIIGEVVAR